MTLEEAIRIKRIWIDSGYAPLGPNEVTADNLSIEALKWRLKQERASTNFEFRPLPGQTKEGGRQ